MRLSPACLTPLAAILVAIPLSPAFAASDPDLAALRDELKQMRAAYEQRIQSLETRLAVAESGVSRAENQAVRAEASAAAANNATTVSASSRPASEAAFNPGISLILSGLYTNLKDNPSKRPYGITGFIPSNGEVAPPPRSFSLGESELGISANVDSFFRGQLTLALPPEEGAAPAVEEGFIQTLGLSSGLNLKAGRFLSGIGYQNGQHAHAWDFSDAPLAYKAFFGGQQRTEGVQLKWLAPTDLFLEVGAEAGRGGNFPSTDRNKNGFQTGSLFAHAGGDLDGETSWRAGLSYVSSRPDGRIYEDVDTLGGTAPQQFSGRSRTWMLDGVLKWAPEGNAADRYLKVQGEYFWRRESGTLASDSMAGLCGGACSDRFDSRQSGGYVQGVYKFAPTWRAGYRYDRLDRGDVAIGLVDAGVMSAADFPILGAHTPTRHTWMVDWSPSEFSIVRLQVARDRSQTGNADDQLWLHYIVSLGAHGAHSY